MVNTDDFIKRLEIILDYYSLTASSFADKIGVQRSSLSHLLSGRNKPSLDLILKITAIFPDVDLYWILNGKGTFPKNEEKVIAKAEEKVSVQEEENADLFSKSNEPKLAVEETQISEALFRNTTSSDIEKIVILYKDGTFSEFKPR